MTSFCGVPGVQTFLLCFADNVFIDLEERPPHQQKGYDSLKTQVMSEVFSNNVFLAKVGTF